MVLLLVFKNYEIWTQPLELPPQKEEPKQSERKIEIHPAMGVVKDTTSNQSFISIAEKNIFSPERKDFPIQTSGGSKTGVRAPIILYGVTIAGNYQVASIVNPGRPLKKGERELMTLKIGDQVGGYKLAKILSDRITLEAEGDTFEVLLYDPRMPKRRIDVKTENKPAMVTSIAPSSTGISDGKGKSAPPKDLGAPSFRPTSTGGSKAAIRKEAAGETKELAQEKTSSQTPASVAPPLTSSPATGPAPTPTQIPAPMAPTPIIPPFTPTPITLPPEMGGAVPSPSKGGK
jgi:hypothetical protein